MTTTPVVNPEAPEWAQVGKELYVRFSSATIRYARATVVRHTKSQIIVRVHPDGRWLEHERKFNKGKYESTWREVGTRGTYRFISLVALDDERVESHYLHEAREAARTQVNAAIQTVRTVEDAEKVMRALGEFITTMHALDQKEA
jgi:hypothetical protein